MQLIILVFFCVFLVAYSDNASAELNWHHLTKNNFTAEHNRAILRAHVKNDLQFLKILERGEVKGITVQETIFTLYNNNSKTGTRIYNQDVTSLEVAQFDKSKPVFFGTHGYQSTGDAEWMINLKSAHLEAYDCTFITIDWSECAQSYLYPTAKDCTLTVGSYLAEMINFLGQQGADVNGMHLMGHSLGAHLVAQVSQHKINVSRITGLDPAGPLFSDDELDERIDPSDADYVDIIHTDCNTFGYDGILGHVDFFPNSGDNQPGCVITWDVLCSHSKSHEYYTDSVLNNYKFPSQKCDNIDEAKHGTCLGEETYMGPLSIDGTKGIYYTRIEDATKVKRASQVNKLFNFIRKYLIIIISHLIFLWVLYHFFKYYYS